MSQGVRDRSEFRERICRVIEEDLTIPDALATRTALPFSIARVPRQLHSR